MLKQMSKNMNAYRNLYLVHSNGWYNLFITLSKKWIWFNDQKINFCDNNSKDNFLKTDQYLFFTYLVQVLESYSIDIQKYFNIYLFTWYILPMFIDILIMNVKYMFQFQ